MCVWEGGRGGGGGGGQGTEASSLVPRLQLWEGLGEARAVQLSPLLLSFGRPTPRSRVRHLPLKEEAALLRLRLVHLLEALRRVQLPALVADPLVPAAALAAPLAVLRRHATRAAPRPLAMRRRAGDVLALAAADGATLADRLPHLRHVPHLPLAQCLRAERLVPPLLPRLRSLVVGARALVANSAAARPSHAAVATVHGLAGVAQALAARPPCNRNPLTTGAALAPIGRVPTRLAARCAHGDRVAARPDAVRHVGRPAVERVLLPTATRDRLTSGQVAVVGVTQGPVFLRLLTPPALLVG